MIGTPEARRLGRCGCGDVSVVLYDGRGWCSWCALIALGAAPARAWRKLEHWAATATAVDRHLLAMHGGPLEQLRAQRLGAPSCPDCLAALVETPA